MPGERRPAWPEPDQGTAIEGVADLLRPGEELVAGRHPVEEAFAARREAVRLLVVPHRREALERLVLHATTLRIPIVEVEGGTLTAVAGFDGHQGIALVTTPRRYATLDDVLARAAERGEAPFVLVLDSLEDPHNVGSLLRTAESSGAHGVLFPTHRQAPLTPAAVKASAGAVEHLLLVPVDDLGGALADLHVRGLRVVGSEADAPLTLRQADLRGPLALVVGSEGQGLGPAVRRRCDVLVRIPMRGAIASLNAAVAGSILLYEATAQRGGPDSVVAPPQEDTTESTTAPTAAEPAPARRVRVSRATAKEAAPAAEPSPGPDGPAPDAAAAEDEELLPGARAKPSPARRPPASRPRRAATSPAPQVAPAEPGAQGEGSASPEPVPAAPDGPPEPPAGGA
ncbi:MAG TPA: 23S rRNA (guanosine(2251)-2'-O)-methyltransferase RlmB [Candidatus Limnocylindrales bacterium]